MSTATPNGPLDPDEFDENDFSGLDPWDEEMARFDAESDGASEASLRRYGRAWGSEGGGDGFDVLGKPRPPSKYSIWHDIYDERSFRDVRADNPDISETIRDAKDHWPTAEELAMDLYASLYKTYPEFEERIDAEHVVNKFAMERALESKDYAELHAVTQLDEFGSAVGVGALTENILKDQDLMEALEQLAQGAPEQQDGEPDEEFESRMKAWQQQQDQAGRTAQGRVNKGMREAKQQVGDANDVINTFGGKTFTYGSEDESFTQTMNAKQKAALARKVLGNQQVMRMLHFIGRMGKIAWTAQRSRMDYAPNEVYDLEMGADLSRVLPQEIAALEDPDQEWQFWRRYTMRSLMQYRINTPVKEIHGPVVVLIDESGSMSGDPDAWAKAAFMVLMGIANKQGRDVRLIHFSDYRQVKVEDFFAKDKADPTTLLKACIHFFGGGTVFDSPLIKALEAIETSEYSRADVVLITDGAAYLSDETLKRWLATKAEKNFRCYGILIEDYGGVGLVEQVCDGHTVLRQAQVGDGEHDTAALNAIFSI